MCLKGGFLTCPALPHPGIDRSQQVFWGPPSSDAMWIVGLLTDGLNNYSPLLLIVQCFASLDNPCSPCAVRLARERIAVSSTFLTCLSLALVSDASCGPPVVSCCLLPFALCCICIFGLYIYILSMCIDWCYAPVYTHRVPICIQICRLWGFLLLISDRDSRQNLSL